MADPKPKSGVPWAAIAAIASAIAGAAGHQAISPAQASTPSGLATSAQVDALSAQLAEYRGEVRAIHARTNALETWRVRLEAVEEERERQGGTRNAVERRR